MFIVGIDIAKRAHEAAILAQDGTVVQKPFSFKNDSDGFAKLLSILNAVSEDKTEFVFGMEATGHYWLNLYCKLVDKGFKVHVVNPVQSDALRNLYIRKTKTDKVDAKIIADLIRFGRFSETVLAKPDVVALRELTRQRFYLVDCTSDVKRKVISLVDKVFPEYEEIFSDMFGATSIELLAKYTTPDDLVSVSTARLANFLIKVSKGRFGQEKAQEIKRFAKNSFGSSIFNESSVFSIRQYLEQIELLEKQISDLDKYVCETLKAIPQTLTTIPGIGSTIAAVLVAEIGDISRFESPDKLAAFAGIDPTVKQSGQFTGDKARMSKRGSPYLRRALYLAAVSCNLHNEAMHAIYLKKRAEGKHHNVALSAISRKLVNIIFNLLKTQKSYIMVHPA